MRNDLLVKKKFGEFFIPTILMAASASLSIIVDSVIVGNILGESELAAVNLIMPMSLCFTAISAMFGIGSSTCISMFKGRMDSKNANRFITLSFAAWMFFSIITVVLGFTLSAPMASFLSGDSGLHEYVHDYLKIYLIGSPFTFATLIFPHIIKADGQPKLSSKSLIIANVSNLVLDVVYMELLHLEITGAALATITGNAIGAIIYITYICSRKRTLGFIKVTFSDLKLYGDMFKMSISSIFGQGLMFAKMWIFNMIISGTAGQAGLTAFSVCTSCLSFVSMFISGGAQTMIPMVGAFEGAKDNTAIRFTVRKAFAVVIGCCAVITVLFELFPDVVMSLYGIDDSAVIEMGRVAIRLFALSFVFTGFTFMFMYYAQAKRMPVFSMQICALDGFVIIVPAGLLLAWLCGSNGIWLSYIVNGILVSLFIVLRSKHTVKRSNGSLYSLFMLKKPSDDAIEFSVDISDDDKIKEAIGIITERVGNDAEDIVGYMFELSKNAYIRKTGLKKGDTVDVIFDSGKLSFKDIGADYRLLEDNSCTEKIKKLNSTYENTLMIGINYSTVILEKREVNI